MQPHHYITIAALIAFGNTGGDVSAKRITAADEVKVTANPANLPPSSLPKL